MSKDTHHVGLWAVLGAVGILYALSNKEISDMNAIAIALHVVAAVIWIGGMFFAYVVLRPSSTALEPPQRLLLWAGVFKRFFPWVWMTIIVLIVTGYWLIFSWYQGFGNSPGFVHVMHILGWIMTLLFVFMYYRLYPAFKDTVQAENWQEAGAALARVRQIILINLIFGLVLLLLVAALQKLA